MNIKKITFFTIILIPVLANAYTTNKSTCTDNCTQAGCGLSQNLICTICPGGTYSTDGSSECTSCSDAPLPTDKNATFAWYNDGATSRDECTFKYTCNNGTIDTKANNSQLTNTNGIHIDNINDYLSPCVKCGTNATPTQNECACTSGTHVKGESSTTTTTTTSADCVPYILSLNLNDPNTPNGPRQSINALTTLNSSTQKYTTPSGILLSGTTDIDTSLTTPNGGTTTIRKTIWGDKLSNHIDTGYKITGWKTSDDTSIDANNITTNHILYPEWTPKQFHVNSDGKNLSVYNSNGDPIASQQCTYTTPCYVMAPTKSGHTFKYWTCKTTNYAGEQIDCTQANVFEGTNISEISYGNNITLTPQWAGNTIEIIYMADYQTSQTKTYTYSNSQNQIESFDDLFKNYTKPAGKEFAYWVCTSCTTQERVDAGAELPNTFTKNTYILQANFAPASYKCGEGTYLPMGKDTCATCPKGYYCLGVTNEYDENEDHGLSPCPAGTTSDQGAKTISDCKSGKETQICDTSGNCFAIPSGITI